MQKKNSLFLPLLLGLFFCSDVLAEKSSQISFWDGVGIAATAVAAGVGIVKLADWFFTENNEQLLVRGESEYNNAIRYNNDIAIFEQAYRVSSAMQSDRNWVLSSPCEPFLYNFATMLFNKGVEHKRYLRELLVAKDQLTALSQKLHSRIDKYSTSCHDLKAARIVASMTVLVTKVDRFLPHITLFCDYLHSHYRYFDVYSSECCLMRDYEQELRIAHNGTDVNSIAYDLRQSVAWRNGSMRYPFIAFVRRITSDINSFKSSIRVAYSYAERARYANVLLEKLVWIKDVVASDERYTRELYQEQQERLERLRIEALREQARIERAQLDAMREQNRILERNNELKRQELLQNSGHYDQSSVSVSIHI